MLSHDERSLFEGALNFAGRQLARLVERHPDFYPMYTAGGEWEHSGDAWTHWCDGFLPGMMWILAKRDTAWVPRAIRYSKTLEPRKHDRNVHDLGFIFMSTYHRWLELTGEPGLKDVIIEAGRTMSLRFRDKGQYLRSFMAEDSVFIDIMMNVGIIFYAAEATGNQKLRDIAMRHSLTSRRVLVRGDGSTAHEGLFDLQTGEFLKQTTQQGFRGDSCWSRGLAWALYGFGACYLATGDARFLQTAEACAGYYAEHTPEGGVPPWDFDAPAASRTLADTSAAAIAASGLLQLAKAVPEGRGYDDAARKILVTLCKNYLAQGDPGWEGVLKGGVYHLHKNLGVNESVMWGEYFFLEALDRALA